MNAVYVCDGRWNRRRERECVYVCVCVRERERENPMVVGWSVGLGAPVSLVGARGSGAGGNFSVKQKQGRIPPWCVRPRV